MDRRRKVAGRPAAPYDREAARERARAVRDWTADAETQLPDAERAILAHAATVALHHGTDRPALPRRGILEATRLGERTIRTALDRMHRAGLLRCEVRGRPGGPATRTRRASCYRLPTDEAMHSYLYRGTRSVGPPGQVCGTPTVSTAGTPVQVCGTPPLVIEPKGESVLTITGRPEDIAAFIDALPLSARQLVQPPAEAVPTRNPDAPNVLFIRRPKAERKPA